MSHRGLLLSLTVILLAIGLYTANTLTMPDWALRARIEATDPRVSSRSATGYTAIGWLHIFALADFASPSDLVVFFRDLQIPIPPILAAAEVITQSYLGSVRPLTVGLYQFFLIGGFVLALVLCRRDTLSMMLCFMISLTFLTAAIESHRLNPQIYDVACPFFLLLFAVALDLLPSARHPASRKLLAVLCGLALAMAELTRPFMIYLLPLLVLAAVGVLRRTRGLLCFFIPLMLLSGLWHTHVAVRYQRLAWTNHAGFNLRKAWPMVEAPPMLRETAPPLQPGRRPNINTDQHSENSRRLSRAVFEYITTHPVEAGSHALRRLYELVFQTPPFYHVVGAREVNYPIYRTLVRICGVWWLFTLAAFASSFFRSGSNVTERAASRALIVAMSGVTAFLAVGDKGEEFRFVVTLLPLFAALPACSFRLRAVHPPMSRDQTV